MEKQNKRRPHYDTERGQMVWLPRTAYARLKAAAAGERRSIARQLEVIVEEWIARTDAAKATEKEGNRA